MGEGLTREPPVALSTRDGMSVLRGVLRLAGPEAVGRIDAIEAHLERHMAHVEMELLRIGGEEPGAGAARHLLAGGGKLVRSTVLLLAASCFGLDLTTGDSHSEDPRRGAMRGRVLELAVVVEMVHAATLLHDDVIDDALERRGRPAARLLWGNAASVLGGDMLLTHALDRAQDAAPAVVPSLLRALRRVVDAELLQLRQRTELDLSEAAYFRVVDGKTATLFRWAMGAGAIVGGAGAPEQEALAEYGTAIGLAFQLIDDVLDYEGDPATTGKALFRDIAEGKVTLPLARACLRDPALVGAVRACKGGDLDAAARVGAAVRASGVCDEARQLAIQETERAQRALDSIPPSPPRALLGAIAAVLAARAG